MLTNHESKHDELLLCMWGELLLRGLLLKNAWLRFGFNQTSAM
ncbi:hypothetical protein Slin_4442 [Spirosoma linguale DSM 74]|uniref:Uncharacterized protein n=1 Tax=Spirosoma linguale (strain ATCC 33905 / DSM 74 / LMG 10896 / Claus 1) TaxID=504472 RepID=D2QML0_SPILD|nr:hypothetical protein Slin_4442 [Spirosoma linguale DSM 74]